MKYYIFLFIAIIFETIATTSLKNSEQFTRLVPSIITVLGYLTAFYFLSLTLNAIPVGVAYAIWSGIGIVLITLVGAIVFKQVPDLAGIVGLCLTSPESSSSMFFEDVGSLRLQRIVGRVTISKCDLRYRSRQYTTLRIAPPSNNRLLKLL